MAKHGKTFDDVIEGNAERMLKDGRQIFRFDTFGDEAFWGGALKLHQAIAGDRLGGVGPGVSPATALAVGLKVDADALPPDVIQAIRRGRVNLNDPAVTLALLDCERGRRPDRHSRTGRAPRVGRDPVLVVSFDRRQLGRPGHRPQARRMAEPRLERRRDRRARAGSQRGGRPAPDRSADRAQGAEQLGPRQVRCAALPRRQGVPAGREKRRHAHPGGVRACGRQPDHLHGLGRHLALERVRREPRDARQGDIRRCPIGRPAAIPRRRPRRIRERAQRSGSDHVEAAGAAVLPAVDSGPDAGARLLRFDARPRRGKAVFNGRANCSSCHVPPLFTEPGWNMHTRAGDRDRRFPVEPIAGSADTGRRHSAACSHGRRAASTTTAASPICEPSSITTTASSPST